MCEVPLISAAAKPLVRPDAYWTTHEFVLLHLVLRALLDHRQARFALRLMARPRGGGEQEILERKSGLTARVREICGLGRRETVEAQYWE